jgi:DNA-binding XRE family transcriptional regulator
MQMTPQQCRMGRAALGWSSGKLAQAAEVRAATISNFENGGEAYASTVAKLRKALEDGGVVFIGTGEASLSGGPGVRMKG